MMVPAIGQAMVGLIAEVRSKVPLDWGWYDPYRFERGELRSSAFQIA